MSVDRRPEFLSVREAMSRLRKRHAFVRELIERDALEVREIEGHERITAASLDRYTGRGPLAST